jgi:hypothetical protein
MALFPSPISLDTALIFYENSSGDESTDGEEPIEDHSFISSSSLEIFRGNASTKVNEMIFLCILKNFSLISLK